MNKTYELRTLDQIDGLNQPQPMKPMWTEYAWPEAKGLPKDRLDNEQRLAAVRIDKGKDVDGWWALDDLLRVVAGLQIVKTADDRWTLLKPADLVKVMTVFRLIGADSHLEVCLPPEYQEILQASPQAADDQVRKAVALQQTAA
ncbi:hypothetical protein [Arthrobacter sp. NPDC058127]|uniref:hypothetical protein n=1 Tax=Arthrobacter sp. NPDC058127 TaxID=3346351 RepID=UPI0036DFDE90